MLLLRQFWLELVKVRSLAYITSIISQPSTRIKISQAITGLLAQQPCNNTVNMIGKITVLFKTQLDTTTKFMVVVTLLFNLVISSFPDNILIMYEHNCWFTYHDGSNNVDQVCSFIKPWTVCSNMHEHWTSLSTTLFKLANSAMFKPVNWPAQPSRWPAQPCSSLWQSTGKNKPCIFKCVVLDSVK